MTLAELPDWLRRLYPFEPKIFACGQARMSYVDEGPRVDEAVLLLHGNPTWSFFYRKLIGVLVRTGFRCVAPDHIGMGLSDKPPNYPYCLGAHIENITALVAQLELRRVHLVVHDWGGAIGFGWAARYPDKMGRMVILNTAAFPAPRIPLRIRLCQTPFIGEWLVRGLNGFAGPATRMAVHRRPLAADVRRGYVFPYDSWANRIGVARFLADIPMRAGHPSMELLEEACNGLNRFKQHRAMIAWGGADFCFDDWFFERWQKILSQSELHYFPGAGHYVLEDAGEEILPLVKAFIGSGSHG